jgi:hypothetical protein
VSLSQYLEEIPDEAQVIKKGEAIPFFTGSKSAGEWH